MSGPRTCKFLFSRAEKISQFRSFTKLKSTKFLPLVRATSLNYQSLPRRNRICSYTKVDESICTLDEKLNVQKLNLMIIELINKVEGRIINLINSIITIKCIRSLGEFNGTKCLKKLIR